jgi:ABC-type nitrate/sulfonate/bicarbonate transport system substrate-binding protein
MTLRSTTLNKRTFLKGMAGSAAFAFPLPAFAQQNPLEITISTSSNGLPFGGLYIAQHAGLFEKNGLKARLIISESGNAATTALLAGSVTFAGSGPSQLLTARARGQDLLMLGNLYRGLSGSLVLNKAVADKLAVKADAPVAARLKALDGMSIASPSATSAYTAPVKNGAASVGATPKLVYMAQPAMPAALEAGAIQGFIGAAPTSTLPVIKGTGVLWISGPKAAFPAEFMPTSSACMQASGAFVKANPDTVKKMQAVLNDIAAFVRDKPAEAKEALNKQYKFDAPTLESVFSEDSGNWTKQTLTVADLQQEVKLLEMTESVPGVKELDLSKILIPPS